MANNSNSKDVKPFQTANLADISSLADMQLGPQWAKEEAREVRPQRVFEEREERDQRPRGGGQPQRSFDRRPMEHSRDRRMDAATSQPSGLRRAWIPLEVHFHGEEAPLETLAQAIRASGKTYPLFELARLILEKGDRWAASVARAADSPGVIWVSMLDNVPFLYEDQALEHALDKGMEAMMNHETQPIEGPKGSFSFVYRCCVTGELIAPPNYHRYHELLETHRRARLPHMTLEEVQSRLEKVTDPDVVAQWIAKMSAATVYTLKERSEKDPESFPDAQKARQYLKEKRLSFLLKNVKHFHLPGSRFGTLMEGPIKHAVFAQWEQQKRFPLITATHLRGRLKRLKLALFKQGGKELFVSASLPKSRTPQTLFSASAQDIINALSAQGKLDAADLILKLLGAQSREGLSQEQEDRRRLALQDLHWLVREGYVVEYSNGRLWLPPVTQEVPAPAAPESSESEAPASAQQAPEEAQEPVGEIPESLVMGVSAGVVFQETGNGEEAGGSTEEGASTEPVEPLSVDASFTQDPPLAQDAPALAKKKAPAKKRVAKTPKAKDVQSEMPFEGEIDLSSQVKS